MLLFNQKIKNTFEVGGGGAQGQVYAACSRVDYTTLIEKRVLRFRRCSLITTKNLKVSVDEIN